MTRLTRIEERNDNAAARRARIVGALRDGPKSHSALYAMNPPDGRHIDAMLRTLIAEGLVEEYIPEGEGFQHTTYRLIGGN